jgi:hypothetical protein
LHWLQNFVRKIHREDFLDITFFSNQGNYIAGWTTRFIASYKQSNPDFPAAPKISTESPV